MQAEPGRRSSAERHPGRDDVEEAPERETGGEGESGEGE